MEISEIKEQFENIKSESFVKYETEVLRITSFVYDNTIFASDNTICLVCCNTKYYDDKLAVHNKYLVLYNGKTPEDSEMLQPFLFEDWSSVYEKTVKQFIYNGYKIKEDATYSKQ